MLKHKIERLLEHEKEWRDISEFIVGTVTAYSEKTEHLDDLIAEFYAYEIDESDKSFSPSTRYCITISDGSEKELVYVGFEVQGKVLTSLDEATDGRPIYKHSIRYTVQSETIDVMH